MKRILALFAIALLSLSLTSASAGSPDVADFGLVITSNYLQADTTGPSVQNTFRLNALFQQASSGTLESPGYLTVPTGGNVTGAQSFSAENDGTGNFGYQSAKSSNLAALQADYAPGTYGLSIAGAGDGGTPYSATLDLAATNLAGGTFPGEVPYIANTSWSGSDLVLDPTVANTISWNSFTDAATQSADEVLFQIQDKNTGTTQIFEFLPGDTTSEFLAADFLQPGQDYSASVGFFAATAPTDTTDISGATGFVGYGDQTKFVIETIPEPSRDLLPLLGLAAIMVFGRKCAA